MLVASCQQRFTANNGQLAESGYFRDQLLKELIRQIRILIPATCGNRNRYAALNYETTNYNTDFITSNNKL